MTCEKCAGLGYLHYSASIGERLYCDCDMGRDVQRADARIARQKASKERVEAVQTGAIDWRRIAAGDWEN